MSADDYITMPFGKYRGRYVCQVPADYLAWCLRECDSLDPYLRSVMAESLRRRGHREQPRQERHQGAVMPREELKERLRNWWRPLARKHHPDAGGDGKVMAALNAAKDELYETLGVS
jgi:hypothetical protein